MREALEYAAFWSTLKFLGFLPRPLARWTGARLAALVFRINPAWRRAALFNLGIAFPDWGGEKKRRVIRDMVRYQGWIAAEFAHLPHTGRNTTPILVVEGGENFAAAERAGKGVLMLTGHMGAWELIPFAGLVHMKPSYLVVRPIDNRRVDALVNQYRSLSGHMPLTKDQAARGALQALRNGKSVGILIDQNIASEEAIFVDFFGVPAATTTGLARLARHTGAPVVPVYTYWDKSIGKYRVCADPAVILERTVNEEADIRNYTARFNQIIENYVRRFPDQWLWAHRRWKRRPTGELPVYPDQRK
jgi:KDO2-lipid IV(A) lauroyltransferase